MQSPSTNTGSPLLLLKDGCVGLLGRRETAESLALFRIACGITTLAWILSAIAHGVAADIWLPVGDGGYRSFNSLPWLFELLGGLNPTTLWLVVGVYIVSAVAVTIGLGGRLSAFVLLQAFLAVSDINWHVSGGDCRLTANCLWLLVIAGGTATMSLDCRLREGRWTSDRTVAAWPRYLVFYQLVVVYCATGLQKLSIDWTPAGGYSALYYIMQEPSWQRWDMNWLAWIYPLTQVATAVTWIWEVSAPLLILAAWYRATSDRPGRFRRLFNRIGFRRIYVTYGIMMHVGIFIFIDLGLFTWISLSMYMCLFTSAEWRAASVRVRERIGSRKTKQLRATGSASEAPDERQASGTVRANGNLTAGPVANRWMNWPVYGFVAFHLVAITLAAMPAPPASLTREDLATGDEAANLAAWSERLNTWGLAVSQTQLEDTLWTAADRYGRIRKTVLTPFQPYYELCGTSQGWKMFVGPHRNPSRVHIDIHEDGTWRPIYIQGSREHDWLRSRLKYEHWRTAIFTMVYYQDDEALQECATWLAGQAATDFPDADELRVRAYTFRSLSPAEVKDGKEPRGQFEKAISVSLKE